MTAALFLDRDDTIIGDEGYMSDPAQIRLLPGVGEALRNAAHVFRLYLITNQSGIGRGFYSMEQAVACNDRLIELLKLPSPGFHGICIAPETPDDPQVYRKPSPKYILEMIKRDGLDPNRCYMIGDRTSDLESGINAGIESILVGSGNGEKREKALEYARVRNLRVFPGLPDAVKELLNEAGAIAGQKSLT